MMKAIKIGIVGLILALMSGCQSTAIEHKTTEITETVQIPNKSQEEIYNKTRQWFSQYFVSGESVVDYEDKATGTIIGNGIAENGSQLGGLIIHKFEYNIRIDTKDEKLRAVVKIIKHTNTDSNNGTYTAQYIEPERKDLAEAKVKILVQEIKDYILTTPTNDDW